MHIFMDACQYQKLPAHMPNWSPNITCGLPAAGATVLIASITILFTQSISVNSRQIVSYHILYENLDVLIHMNTLTLTCARLHLPSTVNTIRPTPSQGMWLCTSTSTLSRSRPAEVSEPSLLSKWCKWDWDYGI